MNVNKDQNISSFRILSKLHYRESNTANYMIPNLDSVLKMPRTESKKMQLNRCMAFGCNNEDMDKTQS